MPSTPFLRSAALAVMAAAGMTLVASFPAAAQDAPSEPLALRKIMRDMGRDMEAVTRAISAEDWDAIAALAPRLADHPQPPPGEKVRILTFLGGKAADFRAHDQRVHDAALALQKAAAGREGASVIGAFATLQGACLGCHQAFRPSFVEHFHGTR